MSENQKRVQFIPFRSEIRDGFWFSLSEYYVKTMKLDKYNITCMGSYTTMVSDNSRLTSSQNPKMRLDSQPLLKEVDNSQSFLSQTEFEHGRFPTNCLIKFCATLEEFKAIKGKEGQEWLQSFTKNKIWNAIVSGEVLKNPSLLTSFTMIVFPDVKKYIFQYRIAYPRLQIELSQVSKALLYQETFSSEVCHEFLSLLSTFLYSSEIPPYQTSFFILYQAEAKENRLTIDILSKYESLTEAEKESTYFGFIDSSQFPDAPGWMLCNYMAALNLLFDLTSVKVLSFRGDIQQIDSMAQEHDIETTKSLIGADTTCVYTINILTPLDPKIDLCSPNSPIKVAGFEKNAKDGSYLHERKLPDSNMMALQAANLNVDLMTHRSLPGLKLNTIRDCKCLLIGAGTLGCNVARNLLAWGVPEINFIDSGKVSYSNPVRQTLFTFNDCLDGGRYKAEAAAQHLKEIFPHVETQGFVLSIPMPGHDFTGSSDAKDIQNSVHKLDELIKAHDVIYLLTDSRESRWLPTVIAAKYDKMLLNAALGFDTFVVMRHGGGFQNFDKSVSLSSNSSSSSENEKQDLQSMKSGNSSGSCSTSDTSRPSSPTSFISNGQCQSVEQTKEEQQQHCKSRKRLGCYFCNDIVAPINSTKDRTLDQQCTVTRPALSSLASSLAVELMISLLHHQDQHHAPADEVGANEEGEEKILNPTKENGRPLGLLPQQIRGFLATYNMILPAVYAFDKCTACSKAVVGEYERRGAHFVEDVVRSLNGSLLENISGISKDKEATEKLLEDVLVWDSDEEMDDF